MPKANISSLKRKVIPLLLVRRMIDTIVDHRAVISLHIDVIKTGDVDPVFIRVTTPEMMGVDPAGFAEIMPGHTGIPGITAEIIPAGYDAEFILWHRRHDRPAATAERAVTTAPLRKIRMSRNREHHLSAMA